MQDIFRITVRTPEAEVVSRDVESLSVSTETGEMMILPEHAALGGVISFSPLVLKSGDHEEQYLVQRGVLFFSNERNEAVILCSRCDTREKLDFNSVKEYLRFVEEKLAAGEGDELSAYQYRFLENERLALVQQVEEMQQQ